MSTPTTPTTPVTPATLQTTDTQTVQTTPPTTPVAPGATAGLADIRFPTDELRMLRSVLQNETAWDRDLGTRGFNRVYSADNPERIMLPVHEEPEWKLLNSAMLRIDAELERRQRQTEKFSRIFGDLPVPAPAPGGDE